MFCLWDSNDYAKFPALNIYIKFITLIAKATDTGASSGLELLIAPILSP
ncbi:hypothetical protein CRENPOLYSF2_1390007 [Crenothrix polyspora]|uniref:Uncharacterized protein n=1 Tax=Crenothrix polyspora TaxID=360316 RepID=A0A1R4H0W9_9GAMM|nr:hypothetical protein CRENPOLYSF2_1390007 [Crenothrix polyspora]